MVVKQNSVGSTPGMFETGSGQSNLDSSFFLLVRPKSSLTDISNISTNKLVRLARK